MKYLGKGLDEERELVDVDEMTEEEDEKHLRKTSGQQRTNQWELWER